MPAVLEHPALRSSAGESALWLPPARLERYEHGKAAAGAAIAAIFVGWLYIQRSSTLMVVLAASLILVTAWVTIATILQDRRRFAGRQIELRSPGLPGLPGTPGSSGAAAILAVTKPHTRADVPIAAIAAARWIDDPAAQAGLWLFDAQGRPLAHLDENFLADQSEARAFLTWARQRTELPFNVHWPAEQHKETTHNAGPRT